MAVGSNGVVEDDEIIAVGSWRCKHVGDDGVVRGGGAAGGCDDVGGGGTRRSADIKSVQVISEALAEFKESGLTSSLPKSIAFFCNVTQSKKDVILGCMPFDEGTLPVYWASVFVLPDAIIKEMEKIMRGFLWCQGEQSLWVKWIHTYRLANRNFWIVDVTGDASWGWRKILKLRDVIRDYFVHIIGNGKDASAWYDSRLPIGLLIKIISARDIFSEGFTLKSKVADLICNHKWKWSRSWETKYPQLCNLTPHVLTQDHDKLSWRAFDGSHKGFNVNIIWNTLCPRANPVPWYYVIGHSHAIPSHAFIMWLIMGESWKSVVAVILPVAHKRSSRVVVLKLIRAGYLSHEWNLTEVNNR
ncbi:uncharacterized protein [Rutidosis leptorrhynchoides]|uniref:uncharacterized protein n=1 Tax=Rutidosis leptorrhynchoides TaxID=125765 RepID=UPI003A9A3C3A